MNLLRITLQLYNMYIYSSDSKDLDVKIAALQNLTYRMCVYILGKIFVKQCKASYFTTLCTDSKGLSRVL